LSYMWPSAKFVPRPYCPRGGRLIPPWAAHGCGCGVRGKELADCRRSTDRSRQVPRRGRRQAPPPPAPMTMTVRSCGSMKLVRAAPWRPPRRPTLRTAKQRPPPRSGVMAAKQGAPTQRQRVLAPRRPCNIVPPPPHAPRPSWRECQGGPPATRRMSSKRPSSCRSSTRPRSHDSNEGSESSSDPPRNQTDSGNQRHRGEGAASNQCCTPDFRRGPAPQHPAQRGVCGRPHGGARAPPKPRASSR